jgi:hypothetical protein
MILIEWLEKAFAKPTFFPNGAHVSNGPCARSVASLSQVKHFSLQSIFFDDGEISSVDEAERRK